MKKSIALIFGLFAVQANAGIIEHITNGDFETGDFSGWNRSSKLDWKLGGLMTAASIPMVHTAHLHPLVATMTQYRGNVVQVLITFIKTFYSQPLLIPRS